MLWAEAGGDKTCRIPCVDWDGINQERAEQLGNVWEGLPPSSVHHTATRCLNHVRFQPRPAS